MTFAWHHPNYYKKLKREAASSKQQAIQETVPHNDIEEAQASSSKPHYQINYDDFCKGDEEEPQASSSKPQAPSVKHQASSSKPKRSDQKIPEPRSTNQQ